MLFTITYTGQNTTDLDNLPEPDVLAAEIMENLETALESFKILAANLDVAR